MYYEINISKRNDKGDYIHFFATAERSITSMHHLKIVYTELAKAFPEPEYNITASYNQKIGEFINIETLKS